MIDYFENQTFSFSNFTVICLGKVLGVRGGGPRLLCEEMSTGAGGEGGGASPPSQFLFGYDELRHEMYTILC